MRLLSEEVSKYNYYLNTQSSTVIMIIITVVLLLICAVILIKSEDNRTVTKVVVGTICSLMLVAFILSSNYVPKPKFMCTTENLKHDFTIQIDKYDTDIILSILDTHYNIECISNEDKIYVIKSVPYNDFHSSVKIACEK